MDNLFELEKLFVYENMAHKANRSFSSFFQDVLSFNIYQLKWGFPNARHVANPQVFFVQIYMHTL